MRKWPVPAVLLAMLAAAVAASAQPYPSRPITIVVPTSAGGPPDIVSRILAERMRQTLGQPIVIENTTGAGGTLGVGRVVRAAPDGYTVSIGHLNSHVFSGATYNLPFDLLTDLEPVAMLVTAPMILLSRIGLPVNDAGGLVAWLKANPDKLSFGSVGVGGPGKVWATHFQKTIGTRFAFVPYRGASQIIQDLIAGQIDLACLEASNVLPHVHGGKIKTYAVLASTRWRAAPDIPTIEEARLPGLTISFWHGFWVPKGTSKEIIGKLEFAAMEALADPMVRSRLADVGQDIFPPEQQTAEALRAHHKAEIEKWWPIIKAAGLKGE